MSWNSPLQYLLHFFGKCHKSSSSQFLSCKIFVSNAFLFVFVFGLVCCRGWGWLFLVVSYVWVWGFFWCAFFCLFVCFLGGDSVRSLIILSLLLSLRKLVHICFCCCCFNPVLSSSKCYFLVFQYRAPSSGLYTSGSSLISISLIPQCKRTTRGFQTFTYFGPYDWNSLPQDIRQCSTLSSFKTKLKTFLFSQYFRSS